MRGCVASLCVAASIVASPARADDFPSRPITIVVPFNAGGPTDTVARVVADRMARALNQSVVIENMPGAGGTIAAARVARALPDGYTIDFASMSTHVISPVLYPLPYDVFRDFAPVALLTKTPLLIMSRKSVPATDMKGFAAWLKTNPDSLLLGIAGATDQMAGYLLAQQTGSRLQSVPYRGLSLALQDLIAGRIDVMFDQPSDALPQFKSGAVKVFAVTAPTRLAVAPDIPTVDEAGLSGLHITPWYSLWVPRATPDDIRAKLAAATMEALADPAVIKRLGDIGQEVVPRDQQNAESLAAFYKAETDKWWPIIKAAAMKAE
ncbi:MAG TPA: tripartite tricarboxylate transporter substrate-binding protein [Xanthobacteraceae bacterium]|jgi:tripartite-type tricarboxylate transporter receptor subunit TctC|nr:tripartite tricarboxylate transporter substrate-binding protein [Xanthobacteraceae bacterium]